MVVLCKFWTDQLPCPCRTTHRMLSLHRLDSRIAKYACVMLAGTLRYVLYAYINRHLIFIFYQQPVLMSAGWLGSGWGANESSVIARHEWKGLSKMRYSLEDYVEQQESERADRARRRAGLRAMPGSFRVDTDEDD